MPRNATRSLRHDSRKWRKSCCRFRVEHRNEDGCVSAVSKLFCLSVPLFIFRFLFFVFPIGVGPGIRVASHGVLEPYSLCRNNLCPRGGGRSSCWLNRFAVCVRASVLGFYLRYIFLLSSSNGVLGERRYSRQCLRCFWGSSARVVLMRERPGEDKPNERFGKLVANVPTRCLPASYCFNFFVCELQP